MYPQAMTQNRNNINPYLMQKVMTASPEQLISYIYDIAISACAQKDHIKATQAVQELINSLNFDYKEQSLTFFRIYRYRRDQDEVVVGWTLEGEVSVDLPRAATKALDRDGNDLGLGARQRVSLRPSPRYFTLES